MSKSVDTIPCSLCDKVFTQKRNLNRHLREVHNQQNIESSEKWLSKCLEAECGTSFSKIKLLIEHLNAVHSCNFREETHVFANMEEFLSWKQSMEEETCSSYVVYKYKNNKTVTYFRCNRSKTGHDGRDVNKIYKRNCKSKGPYHMDTICTSYMKLFQDGDGKLTVDFQRQHYGHSPDLSKIRLPKYKKQNIATKLINGVPCRRIIHTVTDNIGEHLERIDILTTKDVNNIKKSYGIKSQDGKLICKHIHYNVLHEARKKPSTSRNSESNKDDLNLVCGALNKSQDAQSALNQNIQNTFNNLLALDVNSMDSATVDTINFQLTVLNKLMNIQPHGSKQNNFVSIDDNKNKFIKPQVRFSSTKRKNINASTKSTESERAETKKMLQNLPSLVISTNPSEDHHYYKTIN